MKRLTVPYSVDKFLTDKLSGSVFNYDKRHCALIAKILNKATNPTVTGSYILYIGSFHFFVLSKNIHFLL